MTQGYSDPEREDDPYALPDIEVFRLAIGGWFYWYCLPGCLLFFKLLANAKKSGRRMS
jgi:hypothetical protein